MRKYYLFMLLFISPWAISSPIYNIGTLTTTKSVNSYWEIPTNKKITVNNILKVNNSTWLLRQNKALKLPVANQGYWFAIVLNNSSNDDKLIHFSISNHPLVEDIALYSQNHNRLLKEIAFSLNNNLKMGHVIVAAHTKTKILIYAIAQIKTNLLLKLYGNTNFIKTISSQQFNAGIAMGGLIFVSLIQLLWFFSSGLKSALLLTGHFVFNSLLLFVLLGWNLSYLLPNEPELNGVAIPILASLSTVMLLWFTIELFNLRQSHANIIHYIRYFCWLVLLYLPLSLLLDISQNLIVIFCVWIITSLFLLKISILLIKEKNKLSLLLMIFSILILLFNLTIASCFYWFQLIFINYHTSIYYVGFWSNSLLICFILSRHYSLESQSKTIAQHLAIDNAMHSEKMQCELIALQSENQEKLEQHVQERTLELNIALQELEEVNQELARKNTLDELTGLNNRRFYDQKILAEFRRSKRNLTPLSLILIDIDHFKNVNDTYGHQAGDLCLQKLGQLITSSLKRSADTGCRYGGEEFCLILPDTDTLGAIEFAEDLRHKVSQIKCEHEDTIITMHISCGISTYKQQENVNQESIFAAADKALYQAKNKGRDQTWQFAIEDL